MAKLANLTEFLDELSKNRHSVILFKYASCVPCKQMKPVLMGISDQIPNFIHFLDVDIVEQLDIAQHEKVKSVPLVRFYIDGKTDKNLDVKGFNLVQLQVNFNKFLDRVYDI